MVPGPVLTYTVLTMVGRVARFLTFRHAHQHRHHRHWIQGLRRPGHPRRARHARPRHRVVHPRRAPRRGTYRGPNGVLQFFGKLQETYSEFRVEPERFSGVDDDRVLVEGHHRGRLGDQTFEVAFIHLWTLRDGVAVAYREYCDSGKLLVLFQNEPAVHR